MTESHATDPEPAHPPAEPTRPDWEAVVLSIADKARPLRDRRAAERTARDRDLARARAAKVRAANRERALAMIPPRYVAALPDHPAVRAWTAEVIAGATTDGLVLNGRVGVGKTHQAYGAFRAIVERTGCTAAAVSVPAYLDSLRPGRSPLLPIEEAERAHLLLLDDLAAERDSDWTKETVYRLIDGRWNACRPTIITLNAPGSSLRERLGDRVASRLNGLGRILVLDGPDRRGASTPT